MREEKWKRRQRKRKNKRKMIVDGKGLFDIQEIQRKRRDQLIKKKRRQKEKERDK